jgi:hypothetical protein
MIMLHVRRNFNVVVLALVTLLMSPMLMPASSTNRTMLSALGGSDAARINDHVGRDSKSSQTSPGDRPVVLKRQSIYAPHWTTEGGFQTELYLRNVHLERPVTAEVSLLVNQGRLRLDPIEIGPLQTVSLDVGASLSQLGVSASQTGGAIIDFEAESAGQMSAYAQVLDTERSLAFDFHFLPISNSKSGPLEAVTWYYSKDTEAFIALQNTKHRPVSALTTVFVSGKATSLGKTELQPNETAIIKLSWSAKHRGVE